MTMPTHQPRPAVRRTTASSRNRLAAAVTAGAGVLAVLIAWAAVGSQGPLSALLGLLMVLAFFSAGSLPFAVAGDGSRAGLAFVVLGMTYVLRILLGGLIYAFATTSDGIHSRTVGLTVIGCSLVWLNTQVLLGLSRRHQATLDL